MGGVKSEADTAAREKLNDYLLHFPLWTPQTEFIKSSQVAMLPTKFSLLHSSPRHSILIFSYVRLVTKLINE
jgi:hypothetical protein